MKKVIEVSDLVFDYPQTRAVNKISLTVFDGEIFGLVGPDGAGKTTTLKILATILKPTSGKVLILGQDVVRKAPAIRGAIGYMSERFNLYEDLTVYENLRFFADLYRIPASVREERMKKLLAFARLEQFADRRVAYLSGGMKQKLALSTTLIHEPKLLFLDEPTTGVDPLSRREFWLILSELHRQGATIFITTPYMDEAERCSRIAFMEEGEIKLVDSPRSIKQSLAPQLIELVARPLNKTLKLLYTLSYVEDVQVVGKTLKLAVAPSGKVIDRLKGDLRRAVEIISITPKTSSLETAFTYLIKKRGKRA
jgi:ABC-2 type transport system ATP-binding protein